MRSPLGVTIFLSLMLLLDWYFFAAVKTVSQHLSPKAKTIVYSIYWGITVLAVVGFLLFVYTEQQFLGKRVRTYLFATILGLFLAKSICDLHQATIIVLPNEPKGSVFKIETH